MKIFKNIICTSVLIFGLNFIWEISQAFLYQPHYNGVWGLIAVHAVAALGDVLMFFIIYLIGSAMFRNPKWFLKKDIQPFICAAGDGFVLAVLIEKWALATGRWAYGPLMPLIPVLQVGLTPVLQMTILPVITLLFIRWKYNS